MSVSPSDLEGVRADLLSADQFVSPWSMGLRLGLIRSQKNSLPLTRSAWTMIPQRCERYDTLVPVIPEDEYLILRTAFDLRWSHDTPNVLAVP